MSLPTSQYLKRTYSFWFLWMGYAFVSVSGWMRMVDSITGWYWLTQAGVTPGPLYLTITGAAWGLVGLAAVLWLTFNRPWSRLVGLAAALFFALTYWIDRLFVAQNSVNLAFGVGFTLFCLAFVGLVLRPVPEVRAFLKR